MIDLNNLPAKIAKELHEDCIEIIDTEVSKQFFEDSKIIFDCLDATEGDGTTIELFLSVLSYIDFSSPMINDNVKIKVGKGEYDSDKDALVSIINFIEVRGDKDDFYKIPEIIHCYKSRIEEGHKIKEHFRFTLGASRS